MSWGCRFECNQCHEEIEVGPGNTIMIYFEREPFYSYLLVSCECHAEHRLFPKLDAHQDFVELGLGVTHIPHAPDAIKEAWLVLYSDEPEYVDECFGVGQTDELPTTDEILDEVLVVDFNRWLAGISPDDFAGGGES